MIGKGYQLIKYYYIYYSLGAKLKRFISPTRFSRAMRTQKNEVDVSDRALAATFDQSLGNTTENLPGRLEQLCTDKPERAAVANHCAKRFYEFIPVIASLAPAIVACFISVAAVKAEDAYKVLTKKAEISRLYASPFYAKEILMPDNSSRSQWKIRTMEPGANSQYQQMVEQGIVRPGEYKSVASRETARSDPRITPVGRFLREYSIDEAPQVFQLLRQYFGKGLLYSPNNHYFFGNRPQTRESIMNASSEDRQKLRGGPCGLVGLDCVGRGRPDHDKEANNNHRYSEEYRSHFILPTDLRIGKGLIKAVLSGSNS